MFRVDNRLVQTIFGPSLIDGTSNPFDLSLGAVLGYVRVVFEVEKDLRRWEEEGLYPDWLGSYTRHK